MYNQGYTPQQPQQGYPYYPQGSNPAWYAPPPQQAPAVEEPAVEKSLKKSAA